MLRRIREILYILAIIIMLIIIFISGVILINSYISPEKVPSFFGWKPFIVLSGSMQPTINKGDIAVIKEINPENVKEDDVIAFRQNDIVITHRIVEITEENGEKVIYTKGDHNKVIDSATVYLNQIEGIYQFRLKGLGNVAMFIQTPTGIIACLSIPLVILIILQILSTMKDNSEVNQEIEQTNEIEGGETNERK